MIFSSIFFIYYFLPILLLCYFIVPKKFKNYVLLIFSLLFYVLGEPKYIFVLLLSCIVNYFLSKRLEKKEKRKLYLIIALVFNIATLFIFKYTDFFIENINNIFNLNIPFTYIKLPIGISFYTFQILGYIIDVYNKKHKSATTLGEFMTYVSLFPQLVAGPIVRFSEVKDELKSREHSYDSFAYGVKRFVLGLSKKVLLANTLGELVGVFATETVLSSWIKAIAYTLQIYFDFSGYSDMAIGLGSMFGFKFPENFRYPLIASSITDFWRRWHITLSSWFRDYVYIPCGGSRVSKLKWIRNIFIVWFLTGFWHGASWNFIIWGLYFGIILVLEKIFIGKHLEKTKITKYVYSSLIIIVSFVIFRSTDLSEVISNLKNMFFMGGLDIINKETIYHLRSNMILIVLGIMCATPLAKFAYERFSQHKCKRAVDTLEPIVYLLLLVLCTAFLIDESFNPFLYFRF